MPKCRSPCRTTDSPRTPSPADGIYSVNVPTSAVGPGLMLRWRIVATDTNNSSFRAPAYFAAVDNEQYYGTVALGADPASNLPVTPLVPPKHGRR